MIGSSLAAFSVVRTGWLSGTARFHPPLQIE
jgi:hypothetical protein